MLQASCICWHLTWTDLGFIFHLFVNIHVLTCPPCSQEPARSESVKQDSKCISDWNIDNVTLASVVLAVLWWTTNRDLMFIVNTKSQFCLHTCVEMINIWDVCVRDIVMVEPCTISWVAGGMGRQMGTLWAPAFSLSSASSVEMYQTNHQGHSHGLISILCCYV